MCRFNHETTAFCLVENDVQETVKIRAELLQKLRNMISVLIKEKPVTINIAR